MAGHPEFLARLLAMDLSSRRRAAAAPAPGGAGAIALHDGAAVAALPDAELLIARVREGLPARSFKVLVEALSVSAERLAGVLQIAPRTLARRTVFKPDESARILRVGRLFQRTLEVMGSEAAARGWLLVPQWGLGGAIPLDYADTEAGAREVEVLLGRIEHGVVA
jgi:putative toxin-antitoxin system antitoxin component (TIGR02293 family)